MPDLDAAPIERRSVLRATGVVGAALAAGPLLSACSGGASPDGAASGTPAVAVKIPVASVPVGSGVISQGIVVLQPKAGTFLAFDATCPHQGCTVNKITADQVICPCHQSAFSTADGSVTHGPAQQGLAKLAASVAGDQVVVG